MTQTRQRIDFLNTSYDEVEKELLSGKPPREVAELLAEPIPNVMGVWSDLRNAGKVQPQNFPVGAARPAPQNIGGPPRHTPNPDLSQRIAGATDLLVRAAEIDERRIQAALGRARKAMTDLAGLVEKYESKASTRSEIAKLEAQIRVLKAELTGPVEGKRPLTDAQREHLAKMREQTTQPVDCPKCGRTCASKAGLSSHERNCTGTAA
jgi:hypothetical protein